MEMENYFKAITVIERLNHLLLEAMKIELIRMKVYDINPIQCLLLYKINKTKCTVGELTDRGYYLGANASYNILNLVKNGYMIKEKRGDDGRSSYIKLSRKGINFHKKLESVFLMHAKALEEEGADLDSEHEDLWHLESLWKNLISTDFKYPMPF
jgi:DNA-binding MarR family transcriptional regulator